MIVRTVEYLRAHLRAVTGVCLVLMALIAVWGSVVAYHSHHTHYFFEKWPGFWSVFGFGACFILVTVARWFGKCVKTREDYYDD